MKILTRAFLPVCFSLRNEYSRCINPRRVRPFPLSCFCSYTLWILFLLPEIHSSLYSFKNSTPYSFLVVKIFWSRKYIFVSINHIWFFRLFWESSRSWVYIMVLVMKSACLKIGQVVCKPAENFPSIRKKSDPRIEINDDINVKAYFSSVKTT